MIGKGAAVIWLTGVSATGKTTISRHINASARLSIWGPRILLDADVLRKAFWPELGLSDRDREKNVLRIGNLAATVGRTFPSIGLIIVSCIAPEAKIRDRALQGLSASGLTPYLIHLHAPLVERIKRDPKGLYDKALRGEIENLTGYDGRYDLPVSPFIGLDTSKVPQHLAGEIIEKTVRRAHFN